MARNELMAEEVLEKFSRAVAQNAITLREAKTSSDLYYFSFQIYSGFTGSCKKREKRRSSGTGTCRCSGSGNSAGS